MLETGEITKSLPSPRDDEPASLRQDIVDEIRDHIQCSLRRELLVGRGDETQARQRVLDKFGNPHLVARRLWFQAMWSKIMTQRLVIGSLVCSMAVSITLVVMVGLMLGQMNEQHRDQQREQQVFNAALIEKIGSMMVPPATAAPRDPNWNHLQIKVTVGTKDGPPATGVQIHINRWPRIGENLPKDTYEDRRLIIVDHSGVADCGDVQPGAYHILVITASNESTMMNFTVKPGTDHLECITVPASLPELTKVSLEVEEIMPGPKLKRMVVARFYSLDREVAGQSWSVTEDKHDGYRDILGGSTLLVAIDTDRRPWVAEIRKDTAESWSKLPLTTLVARASWSPLDSTKQFDLPTNQYGLSFIGIPLREDLPFGGPTWRSAIGSSFCHVVDDRGHTDWQSQKFTAKSAEANLWRIHIPNDVIEHQAKPQ
jgi:hypothetical protein